MMKQVGHKSESSGGRTGPFYCATEAWQSARPGPAGPFLPDLRIFSSFVRIRLPFAHRNELVFSGTAVHLVEDHSRVSRLAGFRAGGA
jgi:hypothetical protein